MKYIFWYFSSILLFCCHTKYKLLTINNIFMITTKRMMTTNGNFGDFYFIFNVFYGVFLAKSKYFLYICSVILSVFFVIYGKEVRF